eukprot:CAMPEP_0194446448 /NCGR_PEP_ID=MMETSP0176-20130528/128445_1 /TAXON_ID=216777 /ORGANISM="Proboscia alata, Strain PI-D3" /LENGTH=605 /DNA_ID=CAMNT_0039273163 /DNA_START=160 /DNA_END=1979 /DNA_ORIENTATION=-
MKIKALSRPEASISRANVGDHFLHHRSLNPVSHPFHKAREYQRAIQAAKLDRIFAKPFIAGLGDGHSDGVTCIGMSRTSLVQFVSGSVDGCIKIWDLGRKKEVGCYEKAHAGVVNGVVMLDQSVRYDEREDDDDDDDSDGENDETKEVVERTRAAGGVYGKSFLSCGDDGMIRQWRLTPPSTLSPTIPTSTTLTSSSQTPNYNKGASMTTDASTQSESSLLNTWRHPSKTGGSFKSLSLHYSNPTQFASASDSSVDVWSLYRSNPISSHSTDTLWGNGDTVTHIRYNPVERGLLAHCSMDRGVGLHDTRSATPLRKTILAMRANCLEWNPMEPMNFVVGSEDYNAYSFDMRRLDKPTMIHKGHVGAVMSVGWSPTGREFVTGGYDATLRIFGYRSGHARDLYYTKRMQRVFAVGISADSKYIVSGSDDTNIRLWRVNASENSGVKTPREENALEYRAALLKKHSHLPEVSKITKSGKRRGPKFVKYSPWESSADSKYIVSGSDDTNIRLWRVNASENSGVKTPREENALEYRAALLKKHSHLPEVSKITKSGKRRGPKFVKKQTRIAQIQKESRGNKLENRIKHSKPGVVKHPNEREDAVAKEIG